MTSLAYDHNKHSLSCTLRSLLLILHTYKNSLYIYIYSSHNFINNWHKSLVILSNICLFLSWVYLCAATSLTLQMLKLGRKDESKKRIYESVHQVKNSHSIRYFNELESWASLTLVAFDDLQLRTSTEVNKECFTACVSLSSLSHKPTVSEWHHPEGISSLNKT